MNKKKSYFIPEIMAVFLCFGLGMLSGYGMDVGPGSWYSALHKPWFNPPNWIFGPVWSLLYLMLGIALGKIWKMRAQKKWPLRLFILQFSLNLIWSPLFFHAHRMDWALYNLIFLWIFTAILICISKRPISLLLCPYWIWITFAGLLNAEIYLLNR